MQGVSRERIERRNHYASPWKVMLLEQVIGSSYEFFQLALRVPQELRHDPTAPRPSRVREPVVSEGDPSLRDSVERVHFVLRQGHAGPRRDREERRHSKGVGYLVPDHQRVEPQKDFQGEVPARKIVDPYDNERVVASGPAKRRPVKRHGPARPSAQLMESTQPESRSPSPWHHPPLGIALYVSFEVAPDSRLVDESSQVLMHTAWRPPPPLAGVVPSNTIGRLLA